MPGLNGAYVPIRCAVLGALQHQDAPAYKVYAGRNPGSAPARAAASAAAPAFEPPAATALRAQMLSGTQWLPFLRE